MSVSFGFYNSVDGDRIYDATDMSKIFDGIIKDGVFDSIGTALQVSAGSGMEVNVGIGRAWFDHTWTYNDAILPLEVSEAEFALRRIDAVVLEVDSSDTVRANTIKMVKGPVGATPSKPAMLNTATVHQHALAYITVNAGVTSISQSNIENAIGTSETPYVTGVLETVSVDNLIAQWQAQFNEQITSNDNEFNTWFEHLQDELDENQAGNLQNQIDDLSETIDGLPLTEITLGGTAVNVAMTLNGTKLSIVTTNV